MDHVEEKTEAEQVHRNTGFQFGQYFLEKRLAHGGMAEVFVGRDRERPIESNRCVVKCILPDLAADPQFLAMFINEAQLAAQINHANVVNVIDFGEQDGLLYMAMEYVDGLDCWRLSRRVHPFGDNHETIAAYIITQVLQGLEHVHEMRDVNDYPLNVVHRDISPSNIYLSVEGDVKLGDFGIANIESPRYRAITYTPKGKFGYVAPEQIEGSKVDKRADIFAAGIVLAELVIGKKLFSGRSQLSVLLEIRDGRYATLEMNADRISKPILDILYKALALSPSNRFSTAAEFRDALIEAVGIGPSCRFELAELVRRGRETSGNHRVSTFTEETPDGMPSSGSEALTDVIGKQTLGIKPSLLPTNPKRPTPSIWDILGDDLEDNENFNSFYDLEPLEDDTPITNDFNPETEWQYTIELSLNQIEGPISFARVMELICEDRIRHDTLVSLNGGPFAPAIQYPELARHIPEYTLTLDVEEIRNPDRRGVLAVDAPAEVILSLALAKETGLLICKSGEKRKEVYVREGSPVYVSSNDTKELLGEYLVSEGVITETELKSALKKLPKYDGHMGDTLVALGYVNAVDLYRAIAKQIRMRFRDLLYWRDGVFEFYRNTTCSENEPEIPLDPYVEIGESLAAYAVNLVQDKIVAQLRDVVLDRTAVASSLIDKLAISDAVYTHMECLLEPATVGDLVERLGEESERTDLLVALYIAIETGIWSEDGVQLPWRTPKDRPETD